MELYNKLQQAREHIKKSNTKKQGHNDYSKYDYFTPEQVDALVTEACKETNILPLYELKRNEFGLFAILTLINIDDPNEKYEFTLATDVPEIKATNVTQQLGGAMTYSKRYLYMSTFDIVDNNLDPDSQNQTKQPGKRREPDYSQAQTADEAAKPWLNWRDKQGNVLASYSKIVAGAIDKKMSVSDLRKHYKISKEVAAQLEADLDKPF